MKIPRTMEETREVPLLLHELGIRGLLHNQEPIDLITAARLAGRGPRVEIGCFVGLSTCLIAAGTDPEDRILSLDLFTMVGLQGFVNPAVAIIGPELMERPDWLWLWRRNVKAAWPDHRIHFVQGDHLDPQVIAFVRCAVDHSAALLYLDGPHDAPSVNAELEAYLPLCRPGAFVVFHDWAPEFGVYEVVNRWVDDGRLIEYWPGYLYVARKP